MRHREATGCEAAPMVSLRGARPVRGLHAHVSRNCFRAGVSVPFFCQAFISSDILFFCFFKREFLFCWVVF